MSALVLLISACDPLTDAGHAHHDHTDAASSKSSVAGVIGIDVYAEGDTVHLLTADQSAERDMIELYYLQSTDGGHTWSEPALIPQADDQELYLSGYGGHPPQIAAHGERVVVMYAIHGDGWLDSGPLITRVSDDDGRNWQHGDGPSDPGVSNAQNFHDLLADAAGTFHAVWLDSRTGKQGLYHARSTDGGLTWSSDRVLDRQTCPCCRNTLAADAGKTLYTLYRDIDPRDMAVTRSTGGGNDWQRLATVGEFDWQYDACPHTGGGLAVAGEAVYATVWTGAPGSAGAHFLKSEDSGSSWSSPQRLGNPDARFTDLAIHANGTLLAIWDSAEEAGMTVNMARSRDAGTSWPTPEVLAQSQHTLAQPRVVATDAGFVAFWIEQMADNSSNWNSLQIRLQ